MAGSEKSQQRTPTRRLLPPFCSKVLVAVVGRHSDLPAPLLLSRICTMYDTWVGNAVGESLGELVGLADGEALG